jgi:hypothetical protein
VDQVGDGGQAMRNGKTEVSGELVLRGAGLAAGEDFALTVAAPGRITLVGDQPLLHNTGTARMLTNYGRVSKVSGTGSSTVRLPFENHGVLEVQRGTSTTTAAI